MIEMLPISVLTVFSISLIVWIYRKLTYWSRQGIPNETSSLYSRLIKPVHFADADTYRKYGRIVGIYEGLRPCLLIGEPELVKKVLISEFENFQNHRIFYKSNQIAGTSLICLENDQFKSLRKILSQLFTSGNLRKMKPLVDECSSLMVTNLGKQLEVNSIVDMKKLIGAYSLDVMASTVFGIHHLDSINSQTDKLVMAVAAFFGEHLSLKSLLLLWFPSLIELFNGYVFNYDILVFLNSIVREILLRNRVIKTRTQQSDESRATIKDFLTLLDESEIQFTDQQLDNQTREKIIIDNGILFIIAGYDTTSTSLSSIFYCLALFPDHQKLIVAEIDSLRQKLNRTELTLEEINSLDYLNACIYESLRCLPPVPRIERRVNRDCNLGSIKLVKDSLIIIPCYAVNHDPDFFTNPFHFDPSRFVNKQMESQSTLDLNPFLPFAAGPRNCIGMRFALIEMKICLIALLTRYQFHVSFETKVPLDYFVGMPVSAPKEVKLLVTLRERLT